MGVLVVLRDSVPYRRQRLSGKSSTPSTQRSRVAWAEAIDLPFDPRNAGWTRTEFHGV